MFSILSRTEAEMKRSSLAQMIFEMSILRLVDVRPFYRIDDMIDKINLLEEEAKEPVDLAIAPSNPNKGESTNIKPVEFPLDQNSDLGFNWEHIKQEVCARKSVFNHYLAQCKVLTFNETNLDLVFIDTITLEQVKSSENLQLVKDVVRHVCKKEINVTLSLSNQTKVAVADVSSRFVSKEKKKLNSLNQNRDKSEKEIIQDALDVFGGVVIK